MKAAKIGVALLLVLVVLGSAATTTATNIGSSTTTEDETTNEKMIDELSRILNKETLNEKDYGRIRALLEKW